MKIAVISDIHGNLEALKSAIKSIEEIGVDAIICLGDIVGYGAQPNECCDLIREKASEIVIGNHDAGSCGMLDSSWFNPVAIRSLDWTIETLSDENMQWLKSLPYILQKEKCVFTHALLYKKEEFYYDDELIPIYYSFTEMDEMNDVSFIGHSHKNNVLKADRSNNRLCEWRNIQEVEIENNYKYIINVGSIGQPRDKVPDASFTICEKNDGKIKVYQHRAKYDIEATARKIIDFGLPSILAERLFLGV